MEEHYPYHRQEFSTHGASNHHQPQQHRAWPDQPGHHGNRGNYGNPGNHENPGTDPNQAMNRGQCNTVPRGRQLEKLYHFRDENEVPTSDIIQSPPTVNN